MKKTQSFSEWNSSFNENDVISIDTATVAEPTTNVEISKDVDTIINSLETLANELSEDLNSMQLDEAEAIDFIKSWIISIKAANAQRKVNKIKMNSVDLEFAAKKAEGDKKQALEDKSDLVKDQASELQKMVNDRFSGKGALVDSKLAKIKIEGQIAIIKRTSGMEDDPARKSDLKTKMKELADKYREEETAIAKLEDDNKDAIEAEKEKIKQQSPKDSTEEKPTEEKPATETPTDTESPEVKKIKDTIKSYQDGIDALESKDKKSKEDLDKIDMLKNAIASEQKRLEKSESPKESLFINAFENNLYELASDIWQKQDWQFDNNSALYLKYSNIIKLEEYNTKLNKEYSNLSIKERFSKLV